MTDGTCDLCKETAVCIMIMGKWVCNKCRNNPKIMGDLMVKTSGATLLQIPSKPDAFMYAKCKCGNELNVPKFPTWEINIIGTMQVRCLNCNSLINGPGIWQIGIVK